MGLLVSNLRTICLALEAKNLFLLFIKGFFFFFFFFAKGFLFYFLVPESLLVKFSCSCQVYVSFGFCRFFACGYPIPGSFIEEVGILPLSCFAHLFKKKINSWKYLCGSTFALDFPGGPVVQW